MQNKDILGGAYSSQYRTLERQHVETIKTMVEHDRHDAIARARKLSLETNKRRKALAVKRKTEAEKEEKRRQLILARRREKQREATERFQRAHISSRPSSSGSGKWSPTQVNTTRLEDALRIVRGSPRTSSAKSLGHTSPTRTYYRQDSDPVNKRYFNKYAHPNTISATTNESLREKQAALHNKSLRNLTNSRSLFEQQLESHQQQVIHQQQKALQDFNEQVLSEIGVERPMDTTLNGQTLERSDTSSLSSVDSLEETVSNDTLRESVDLDSFIALQCGTGDQQNDTNGAATNATKTNGSKTVKFAESGHTDNSLSNNTGKVGLGAQGRNEFDTGSRSGSVGMVNRTQTNDAYNAQLKAELTAQKLQEEKQKYYQLRQQEIKKQLEQQQLQKQQLLQQQQQQELQQKVLEQQQKQQALLQQHFQKQQEEQLERQRQQQKQLQLQQEKHHQYMNENEKSQVQTEKIISAEKENVRPKVHMKAWATPSPHPPPSSPAVNTTQQNFVTHASPYSGKNTHTNVTVTTYDSSVSNYSASSVTSTAAGLTAPIGQPVQSVQPQQLVQPQQAFQPQQVVQPQQQTTQSKTVKQETNVSLLSAQTGSQTVQTGGQTGADKNLSFLETVTNNLDQVQNGNGNSTLPRSNSDRTVQYELTQGKSVTEKVNTEKSVTETKTHTSNKTVPSSPKVPSYQSYYVNSYADRYNATKVPYATETTTVDSSKADGSIAKGTLGLLDGQLTLLPDGLGTEEVDTADTDSVSTLCDDREPEIKEVKGILKKPNKVKTNSGILKKSSSTGNMRQGDIRDSLEITRVHLQTSAEEKHQKMLREQEIKLNPPPVPTKKNVRFADLHYEEQEDQGEPESGQDKLFVKRNKENISHKPPRPVSASAAKTTNIQLETKHKPPRAQSASTIRTSSIPRAKTQIVRPQAAAHIITQNSNNQNGSVVNPDKKVTIINNDFMEKIPAMARAHSTQVVHTVTPTSVFMASSVSYNRPAEQKVNYAVSSIVMPKTDSTAGQGAPFIYPNYNAKPAPKPTSSSANPHQVVMNGANHDGAVFDENGIRIDRTPTDDEINFLWDKVRTCLSRTSQATPDKVSTPTSVVSDQQQTLSRQAAPMHHTYIDGNSLGQFNSLSRVASQQPVYNTNLRRHNSMDNVNGYTKRFGLLQQRKQQPNPNSLKSRQQQAYTVYQAPVPSQQEPQSGIQPAQDVSESMAGFLAAEQLVEQSMSDSCIQQAIDDAQNRQQAFHAARQPKAKSALSIEEQRLLESLDRLNDKLKVTETVIQNGSSTEKQPKQSQQQFTHISSFVSPDGKEEDHMATNNVIDTVGGFRGHTPIISPQRRVIETPQRRVTETANQKARLRITSAHLKRNILH